MRVLKAGTIILVLAAVHFVSFWISFLAAWGEMKYPHTHIPVTATIARVLGSPVYQAYDLLNLPYPDLPVFIANSLLWGIALYALLACTLSRLVHRKDQRNLALKPIPDGLPGPES